MHLSEQINMYLVDFNIKTLIVFTLFVNCITCRPKLRFTTFQYKLTYFTIFTIHITATDLYFVQLVFYYCCAHFSCFPINHIRQLLQLLLFISFGYDLQG